MPKYSKMHYEDTAKILRSNIEAARLTHVSGELGELHRALLITLDFGAMYKADNPRFNRDRFLKACGYFF